MNVTFCILWILFCCYLLAEKFATQLDCEFLWRLVWLDFSFLAMTANGNSVPIHDQSVPFDVKYLLINWLWFTFAFKLAVSKGTEKIA